jgi:hypothetical protein
MRKRKILLALPFGQTIRDVLRSDTYTKLKQRNDIELIIVSSACNNSGFREEFGGSNVQFEHLSDYKPNRLELLWQSFYLSTLAFKSNTIRLYAKNDWTSALRLFIPLSNVLSKVIGRFRLQRLLGVLMKLSNRQRNYRAIFDKYDPDLVVVTRVLRASPDYPILKEAAVRDLPVIALVSSWDNFTTKGFFPFGVKKLVVWNDVMKREAIELFDFPEKDIFISGIPRFDNYFKREGMRNREVFFAELGLDPNKKLLTYTTGNKTLVLPPGDDTSAEADVALYLAEAIANNILQGVQLMVRLHPLADPKDYHRLLNRENVVLQIPGKKGEFRDRLFSKSDDIEIAETVCYSDLVINVASTMTIDSAVFDTPSLSVSFDIRGELPFRFSAKRIYEYEHYRKLRQTGGVHLVHTPEEMIEQAIAYLQTPELNSDKRLSIVNQQCQFIDGQAGARVADGILAYMDSI